MHEHIIQDLIEQCEQLATACEEVLSSISPAAGRDDLQLINAAAIMNAKSLSNASYDVAAKAWKHLYGRS